MRINDLRETVFLYVDKFIRRDDFLTLQDKVTEMREKQRILDEFMKNSKFVEIKLNNLIDRVTLFSNEKVHQDRSMDEFKLRISNAVDGMVSGRDLAKEMEKMEGGLGKKFVLQY